ncbi:MAG: phage minor head protein [Alphaproteobacteria bacterium]|nr:phage minor head protein [Alphaproteobacteria bacterium]
MLNTFTAMLAESGYALKVLPVPFLEAINALKKRGFLTDTKSWLDLWQSEHASQFTVAQSAGYDILGDIYEALVNSAENGLVFNDFKREIKQSLIDKGWVGVKDGVELGTPRRLRLIYDTNMRVSAAQGRWDQIDESRESHPYMRYVAVMDSRTRPAHAALHGTILPIDDPWWDVYYPPCGWRCRCHVMAVSEEQLSYHGWKVKLKSPKIEYRDWTNPKTGEVVPVAAGVDPGWGYHVGKASRNIVPAAKPSPPDLPPAPIATAAPEAKPKKAKNASKPYSLTDVASLPQYQPVKNEKIHSNDLTHDKIGDFVVLGYIERNLVESVKPDLKNQKIRRKKVKEVARKLFDAPENQDAIETLANYIKDGAKFINTVLRKSGDLSEKMKGEKPISAEKFIRDMSVFFTPIPVGTRLKRTMGLHGEGAANLTKDQLIEIKQRLIYGGNGLLLQEPGYLSTSLPELPFSEKAGLTFDFIIGHRVDGIFAYLGPNSKEMEMILPPNTRFVIKSIKNTETGRIADAFDAENDHHLTIEAVILPSY